MLYIYLPVLFYYGNLYVTEGAYAGGRDFLLSQRSFLFLLFSACLGFVWNSAAAAVRASPPPRPPPPPPPHPPPHVGDSAIVTSCLINKNIPVI